MLTYLLCIGYQTTWRSRTGPSTSERQPPPLKRFRLIAQVDVITHSTAAINSELFIASCTSLTTRSTYGQNNGLLLGCKWDEVPSFGSPGIGFASAPAYIWNVLFLVCGELTADKKNRLSKGLEKRILFKMNVKYYEMKKMMWARFICCCSFLSAL